MCSKNSFFSQNICYGVHFFLEENCSHYSSLCHFDFAQVGLSRCTISNDSIKNQRFCVLRKSYKTSLGNSVGTCVDFDKLVHKICSIFLPDIQYFD